jgi:ADP-ribose pyrophosphatase YjhB (NUDIX family)
MTKRVEGIEQFNIRVYALIINDKNEILLTDEERFGMQMTKFPGGGLKPGEGTIDCLKREALEEFGQEIEIIEHFYTTDFFQKALFFDNQQLISIYYLARFTKKEQFRIVTKPFDFTSSKGEILSFRYARIKDLHEDDLSFPIDKFVLKMLKKKSH